MRWLDLGEKSVPHIMSKWQCHLLELLAQTVDASMLACVSTEGLAWTRQSFR